MELEERKLQLAVIGIVVILKPKTCYDTAPTDALPSGSYDGVLGFLSASSVESSSFSRSLVKKRRGNMPRKQPIETPITLPWNRV